MSIEIREVKTRGDLRTFVKVPFRLYRDCPQWVPPLFMDSYLPLNFLQMHFGDEDNSATIFALPLDLEI